MTEPLQFHPLADIFPLMEGEEFDALVADIKRHGLREPIVLYQGKILDGRNRYRACLALGIEANAGDFDAWAKQHSKAEARAYVISKNIHRRHLSAEQKRDLLVKLVAAQPEKSDRATAKQAGVDHKQVSRARRKAEATGAIAPVDKRLGADGKKRRKPTAKGKGKPEGALVWKRNASARNTEAETSGGFYEVNNCNANNLSGIWQPRRYAVYFTSNEDDTVTLEDFCHSLREAKAVAQAHYDKSPKSDKSAKPSINTVIDAKGREWKLRITKCHEGYKWQAQPADGTGSIASLDRVDACSPTRDEARAAARSTIDRRAWGFCSEPAPEGNAVDPEASAADMKTRLDKKAKLERSEILAADARWAKDLAAHDFKPACVLLHILSDDERRAAFMEALAAALLDAEPEAKSKDERPRRRRKKSKVNRS